MFRNNTILIPLPIVLEDTEVVGLVVVETKTVGVGVEAFTVPELAVPAVVWALVGTV